jgi:hypothetical protein
MLQVALCMGKMALITPFPFAATPSGQGITALKAPYLKMAYNTSLYM